MPGPSPNLERVGLPCEQWVQCSTGAMRPPHPKPQASSGSFLIPHTRDKLTRTSPGPVDGDKWNHGRQSHLHHFPGADAKPGKAPGVGQSRRGDDTSRRRRRPRLPCRAESLARLCAGALKARRTSHIGSATPSDTRHAFPQPTLATTTNTDFPIWFPFLPSDYLPFLIL